MPQENTKKLSILYLLKVLKEYSDENHPLTQVQISKKIETMSGISCERKTIAANIANLIDFGFDIQKSVDKKGVYLAQREFEQSEINFLIDAIFSCKSISSKHAKDLAKKLSKTLSVYEQNEYKYIYKTDNIVRSDNKQIFYNIELIHRAIEKNKQISFTYNKYNFAGNLIPREKSFYIVNPYFMVNNKGEYYLVCNNDDFDGISNFKIDEITEIKLLDMDIKPVTKLVGYEKGLDIADYINTNIYMFGDCNIDAKIKLNNEYMVSQAKNWFGSNIRIDLQDSMFYGYVTVSEMALIYWALQYCENVEIIEPVATRKKIKKIVTNLAGKYQ